MKSRFARTLILSFSIALWLFACTHLTSVYLIGGTISGLKGAIVLDLNDVQQLTLYADSDFTFVGGKMTGYQYNVTVSAQPAGLVCRVTSGTGQVADYHVRDIRVSCVNSILVGSWNIQNYGTSKAAKTSVMDVLSKVIMRYDVFFMQEVSTAGGGAGSCGANTIVEICTLLNRINSADRAGGGAFAVITSPTSGVGGSAEKYAVFYRQSGVSISETNLVVSGGSEGTYTRPPMYARVKVSTFDFYVINIHTAPASATQEIQDLPKVANARYPTDPDIMIVGDFNSDGSYFNVATGWGPYFAGFSPVSPAYINAIDLMDSTVAQGNTYDYDRMTLSPNLAARLVTGSAKPYYYESQGTGATCTAGDMFDLVNAIITAGLATTCNSAAQQVSDHYPVQLQLNL